MIRKHILQYISGVVKSMVDITCKQMYKLILNPVQYIVLQNRTDEKSTLVQAATKLYLSQC